MATAKSNSSHQNPYLDMECTSAFLHNLQKRPPEWLRLALDGYEPERLEAIKKQAAAFKDSTLAYIEALGRISAVAASSGEASLEDLATIGWLNSFLADWASCLSILEANAQFELEGGFTPKLAGGKVGRSNGR